MSRIDSTQNFRVVSESENRVEDILQQVYQAMTERVIIRSIRSWVISCPEIPPISPATTMPGA